MSRRPRERIPQPLNERFQPLTGAPGPHASTLLYMWALEAYWAVQDAEAAGRDPGLPVAVDLPYADGVDVKWSMPEAQYLEIAAAVERHGSTLGAVLADAVQRFVEAGGALHGQRRPRRTAGRRRVAG